MKQIDVKTGGREPKLQLEKYNKTNHVYLLLCVSNYFCKVLILKVVTIGLFQIKINYFSFMFK